MKIKPIKIIAASDTHDLHRNIAIPDGDIFVFAGDMSGLGKSYEIEDFALWVKTLPHKIKIVIAGNHDFLFETHPDKARNIIKDSFIYLQDKQYDLYSRHLGRENENWHISFYGSPWQPRFYDWAFNVDRDSDDLKNKWDKIPDNIDILITHGHS